MPTTRERLTRPKASLFLFKDVADIPFGDSELARILRGGSSGEITDPQERIIEEMMLNDNTTRYLLEETGEQVLSVSESDLAWVQYKMVMESINSQSREDLGDYIPGFNQLDSQIIGLRYGLSDSLPKTIPEAEEFMLRLTGFSAHFSNAFLKLLFPDRMRKFDPVMRVYADILLNHVRLERARVFGPVVTRAKIRIDNTPLGLSALTVEAPRNGIVVPNAFKDKQGGFIR